MAAQKIRFSERSAEEIRRGAVKERTVNPLAIILGLLLFFGAFTVAALWKMAGSSGKLTRLKEFQFVPDAPDMEKFELKEPQRDLMRQVIEDQPELKEEKPDIRLSTDPQEMAIKDEVIKTHTMDMMTEVDVRANKLDIQDNLETADEAAADSADAINPVAVLVNEPGDIYAYTEPKPRTRRKVAFVSTAPRPAVRMKISPQQFGDQNAPTVGELGPVDINLFGDGDYLGAIKRGGLETRTAVDAALRWLALHQETDGSWIPKKWDADDAPYDDLRASAPGDNAQPVNERRIANTGFAVMAFLGGGHNLRRGEHRVSVMRAVEWLIFQQDQRTGYVSKNMYAHAICTIALCEAMGRSPDERVGMAARKAVDACVAGVAKDGGWRYSPNAPESDVSVASWFLQALKTAKLANIKFDHSVFSRGLTFIDQATDKAGMPDSNGAVWYQPAGYQAAEIPTQANNYPALTCAGMVIRQFNGMGVKHPLLVRGAELTRQLPPDWEKKKSFYYWYYATYAMHNMGGEYRLWWNRRIRDALLDHQSKRGHQAGSWNPKGDQWDVCRTYTTALGALCLEVYDRYGEALQSFGTVPSVEELFFRK